MWDTCVNDSGYWNGVRSYWRTVTMTSKPCDMMDAPHDHEDDGDIGHYLYLGPLKKDNGTWGLERGLWGHRHLTNNGIVWWWWIQESRPIGNLHPTCVHDHSDHN